MMRKRNRGSNSPFVSASAAAPALILALVLALPLASSATQSDAAQSDAVQYDTVQRDAAQNDATRADSETSDVEWREEYDWLGASTLSPGPRGSLVVENPVNNAAWFAATVPVEPNSFCRMSADVRVLGFEQGEENPGGASVGILEDYSLVDYVTGTDWEKSTIIFYTATQTEITPRLLLGNHAATVRGKAYFKNVRLEYVRLSGEDEHWDNVFAGATRETLLG